MPIFDSTDQDGAAVRVFLLERARELLQHVLDGPGFHDGRPIEPPPPPVDIEAECAVEGSLAHTLAQVFGFMALRDGDEYELQRRDLPEWHQGHWAGHFGDHLLLTAQDELVPA